MDIQTLRTFFMWYASLNARSSILIAEQQGWIILPGKTKCPLLKRGHLNKSTEASLLTFNGLRSCALKSTPCSILDGLRWV